MSKTVFTKVDYDLGSLLKYISLGEIGLPDIQRPFVWKNAKIRDLFDSMYKGYPIGYLLFWQNELTDTNRTIGIENKQKSPRLVIVDGQQRLTSLYAVIKKVLVVRENFDHEYVQIAFNPLEDRFEVSDAAIIRDKAFIPSISDIWKEDARVTHIIREYTDALKSVRTLTDAEESKIEDSIERLKGLTSFPFTTLELASDINEESVSDVFVRINSKGTPLNQADFILTLMSVFWDEGRTILEQFCRESRKPSTGNASPFNYFIKPSPDQLLRVSVGVAFKRARLQYVYSILRGKDLETEKFSDERRVQQFALLKEAQQRTVNLQYWHDFMKCIHRAGFRSDKMISSQNNLLFSYMLYLIGRTEYTVPEFDLRQVIARWFFMSGITGRFSGSPESAMEFDLARLRSVGTDKDFIKTLNDICDIVLTPDFWKLSLPNDLATSSSRSPSLFSYYAALILLDARALFSHSKVADFLDPSMYAKRAAVERHHLFPKGFLNKQGITDTRDVNQIANYALIEWSDNARISDQAPANYIPDMRERFNARELEKMYELHALPPNWERMDYRDFLIKRRKLMARVIEKGYTMLHTEGIKGESATTEVDLSDILAHGESEAVEFKATLRTNLHTNTPDPRMELSILRTLAGFLNTAGGRLCIGVSDNGSPVGIEVDNFKNEDKMSLHLVNIVKSRMGTQAMTCIHAHFDDYDDYRIMIVVCDKSPIPVFLKDNNIERFCIRTGPSTTELSISQTQQYIKQRFKD